MNTDAKVAHIATLARRLRYGIWTVVGLTALAILALLAEGVATAQLVVGSIRMDVEDISGASALVLLVALLPPVVLVVWMAWLCDRLLALYQRGEIFGRANASIILTVGKLIMALAVLGSIAEPLAAWALVQTGAPFEQWSFEPRLGTFFIGLGIVVVGHVMSLGAEIAEDQSLTI